MSVKLIVALLAMSIFIFSSNFASGLENAFVFLFWCHFIILIPIIIVWFVMQVLGFSMALSPVFAGFVGGSAMIAGGWILLIYFGASSILCSYISDSINGASDLFSLPLMTQVAIVLYIAINTLGSRYTAKYIVKKTKQPKTTTDEIIIDAEWSETTNNSAANNIEYKGDRPLS